MACQYLGRYLGRDEYFCHCPSVGYHYGGVTEGICRTCVFRVDGEPQTLVIGSPAIRCAVTTAPRRTPTVQRTCNALKREGLAPITFGEPGSVADIVNPFRLGVVRNWITALSALTEEAKPGELLMVCQDDIICCQGFLDKLLAIRWPRDAGVISPYCPGIYSTSDGLAPAAGRKTWGACCLLFKTEFAREVIRYEKTMGWPYDTAVDLFVGEAVKAMGREFYYMTPSLVQHIGVTSTLGDNRPYAYERMACDFVGE